ncbi:MAG TPA: CRISPR-associated endoribonuclease Cas6 [Firmicutes bacterium]|nr:CRISPR-associated endoribonuclease Cas6 [Bacillota bacterium]
MRIVIHLGGPDAPLIVPIAYSYFIQSALYSLLDGYLARWIHDEGLAVHKRKIKPLCFSRLLGQYIINHERNQITFTRGAALVITSPLQDICQSLATGLLRRGEMVIGEHVFPISKLEAQEPKAAGTSILVKTISPVTVYATLFRLSGAKYTAYFSPGDPDFLSLCRQNLMHKAQALGWEDVEEPDLSIRFIGTPRIDLVKYKNIIVKAHSGRAWISGPMQYLQLALDAGLGAKNSAGFGCLELLRSDSVQPGGNPVDEHSYRPYV